MPSRLRPHWVNSADHDAARLTNLIQKQTCCAGSRGSAHTDPGISAFV